MNKIINIEDQRENFFKKGIIAKQNVKKYFKYYILSNFVSAVQVSSVTPFYIAFANTITLKSLLMLFNHKSGTEPEEAR